MNIVEQINMFAHARDFKTKHRVQIDLEDTDTNYQYVAFNLSDGRIYWIAKYSWTKTKMTGYAHCPDRGFLTAKGAARNFIKKSGLLKESLV